MHSGYTPTLGNHFSTIRAQLKPTPIQTHPTENIIMKVPSPIDQQQQIVPVDAVISQLKQTSKSLLSINSHPADQCLVGVDADTLSQVQVLLIRTEGRERRIDAQGLEDEAAQELELSKDLVKRLTPLVTDIRQNRCSAEEVMQRINEEQDSDRARRAIVGLIKSPVPLIAANEILSNPDGQQTGGSVLLSGEESHHLKVRIGTVNHEDRSMTAKLLACESPTPLFKNHHLGHQTLHLKVPSPDLFFILGQSASLAWPVSLVVTVDTALSSKTIAFHATVMAIKDKATLARRLGEEVVTKTRSLFE